MAKVLLVEDDNNLREIYEARLQAEGYDIVSANDGEQALVVAKNERPDLVISDVMMPKISGFEMLDILRNTDGLKDVKVIMLTALGQGEDKTRADQLGANRYLVKSQVTLEDIVKTAHQLLDDTPTAAAPTADSATDTPAATPSVTATPAASDDATAMVDTTAPATTDEPAAALLDPAPAATPAATATATAAETTAQEEAELAALLNNYEKTDTPAPTSTPDPAPAAEPVVTPAGPPPLVAPAEPTVTPTTDPVQNDKTMAEAVESLSAGSEQKPSEVAAIEVAPDPVETASANQSAVSAALPPAVDDADVDEEEAGNEAVTIAHKKVIQPINDLDSSKPDINDLLAAEEAKTAAAAAVSAAEAPPAPTVMPPTAPAEPTPIPTPAQPGAIHAPNDDVDPNAIAL